MKVVKHSSGDISIDFEDDNKVGLFKEANSGIVIELPLDVARSLQVQLERVLVFDRSG